MEAKYSCLFARADRPRAHGAQKNIPKGFHLSASVVANEGAARLGGELQIEICSEGVESNRGGGDATALRLMICLAMTQGSRFAPTLGLRI